jgi:anti-sigma factor RsiW
MTRRERRQLACRQFVELVTDFLEGKLPPDELQRAARHLESCDGCRAYLEQMRATVRALRQLPPESVSPAIRDEVLAAYRRRHAS